MAIRGNLGEASLADVLQLLALGRKSGVLSLAREGSFGAVHYVDGRVVYAGLVNRRDGLGDRLLRAGALGADLLARTMGEIGTHDERALAEALWALPEIDRGALEREYRALVEDAVYHLFGWNTGTFSFDPMDPPPGRHALVSISADALLLEGARRVDEWTLIARKIPSFDLIFELDRPRLTQREGPLSTAQERLLPFLDGTHDVEAIIERSGMSEFDVGQALFGLLTAGYVQRVGRSATRRPPPPESRVAEHRNLGVAFYRTGMLDEAHREFDRVLELRSDDGIAQFHIGLIQARRGQWAEAIRIWQRLAQDPDAPAAVFHNLACACEQSGDVATAMGHLAVADRRTAAAPDPRTALSRAVLCLGTRDLGGAETALAAAREQWGGRQPSAAWFHAAGLAAALAGDTARAATLLEDGLTAHPHAVVLHNNLAVVQERRGRYELAARLLEHALLEEASCAPLHKNLGDYHYRLQRYDEALESFQRVVRLEPSHGPDVWLKLGNIHYRRGAVIDARDAWQQALRLDPGNRIVQANLAALAAATEPAAPSAPDAVGAAA